MVKSLFIAIFVVMGALAQQDDMPVEPQIPTSQKKFLVSAALTTSTKIKFTDATVKLSGQNYGGFGVEYTMNNSYLLNVGFVETTQKQFGYGVSLFYFPGIEASSYSVTYQGQTANYTSEGGSKISGIGLEGTGNFKLEKFLFLFGVNYVSYNYSPASGASAKFTIQSNIGFVLGASLMPNEKFSIDLNLKAYGMKLRTTQSNGDILDTNSGYMNMTTLGATYYFQ